MRKTKWLAVSCALILSLAAGIGIGLAVPHFLQNRAGSKFFRQLLHDSEPGETGNNRSGTLAQRVVKGGVSGASVFHSTPEKNIDMGSGRELLRVRVVIIGDYLEREGLLRELEEYLKELASATGASNFSSKRHIGGAGFGFQYTGGGGMALLYEHGGGFALRNAVIIMVLDEGI